MISVGEEVLECSVIFLDKSEYKYEIEINF